MMGSVHAGDGALARVDTRQWKPSPAVRLVIYFHIIIIIAFIAYPAGWMWFGSALLCSHFLLGVAGMWPRSRLLGMNLSTLPMTCRERGYVALTFDDGPDPSVTPRVLDLLDRYGAKASFFCVGQRVTEYPELVQDIVRRGHSVENHSYCHPKLFACYTLGALSREISRAQGVIERCTGRAPRFFRAPMGLRSPLLDPVLARYNLDYVSWRRRGYDTISTNAAAVLRRITRNLRAGDVIVLHDSSGRHTCADGPIVLLVLQALLDHVTQRGLRPVSLPLAFMGGTDA